MTPPRRQNGVALLLALTILFISVSIIAELTWYGSIGVQRTSSILHTEQAQSYVLGAEEFTRHILRRDELSVDHLQETWAQPIPPLQVEGGELEGQLEDLQGRFNLNGLVDAEGNRVDDRVEQFERLLAVLGLDPRLTLALVDWIDPDNVPQEGLDGAEDGYYLRQQPAYRTANQPLMTVSELRLVKGFSNEIFSTLAPHVAVLPPGTEAAVNVNTATAPVLVSIHPEMSQGDADALIRGRQEGGYTSMEEIQAVVTPTLSDTDIGWTSQHFRLTARASVGSTELTMYSLLFRARSGGVHTVRRTFGTF